MYWRKTPGGDEEFTVEQFTAPDGQYYVANTVIRPIGGV